MRKDEDNKDDEQINHLDLNKILDLDTPPSNPPDKEIEVEDDLEEKYEYELADELEEEDELVVKNYSRFKNTSEIDLMEALDLLKSLKPNEELVKAINLIENVLKREKKSEF